MSQARVITALSGGARTTEPPEQRSTGQPASVQAPAQRASVGPSLAQHLLVEPAQGRPPVVGSSKTPTSRSTHRRLRIPERLLGLGTWPLTLAADMAAILGVAVLLRHITLPVAIFVVLVVAFISSLGLYRSRLSMSVLDDVPRLVTGVFGATAAAVLLLAPFRSSDGNLVELEMLWIAALAVPAVILARSLAYLCIRKLRSLGIAHRTLIVGAGRVGTTLATVLYEHPEYGLAPVGFIDSNPLLQSSDYMVPVLGDHASLPTILSQYRVRTVVIAFASPREETMIDVIRNCDRMSCEIFVVPRLFEVHHVSNDMDYIYGMPLTRLRRGAHRSFRWQLKRLFDVLASSITLVLLSPLMLTIAGAVRLEGGPGVLFRQVRFGIDGREFNLLKFRSLRPVDDSESATNWNISHDDRLGPVGRFIRKSSLDELPQLFNILRGEMSVVGPRPERPYFVEQFRRVHPRYFARHRVPCGLTGWSQIHGLRGDTSIADRARLDNYYVENWSLWLDLKIILRTLSSVVTRAGS